MYIIKPRSYLQHGVGLVELIMFIVIIGLALAGILSVMNLVTRSSADPLVHKQALAIAESLLEEAELMPFTYCDPDDASAVTATSAVIGGAGCSATVEGIGPEAGEGRYAPPQFDNVNDYAGFAMGAGAVVDITGAPAVGGYAATIGVVPAAMGGIAAIDANGAAQALLITVTVTGPDGVPVVLEGYRTRYSPNGVP